KSGGSAPSRTGTPRRTPEHRAPAEIVTGLHSRHRGSAMCPILAHPSGNDGRGPLLRSNTGCRWLKRRPSCHHRSGWLLRTPPPSPAPFPLLSHLASVPCRSGRYLRSDQSHNCCRSLCRRKRLHKPPEQSEEAKALYDEIISSLILLAA